MALLGKEYERIRARMSSSDQRTILINATCRYSSKFGATSVVPSRWHCERAIQRQSPEISSLIRRVDTGMRHVASLT